MRPLIGVTTSEMRRDETAVTHVKAGDPPHPEMALGIAYLRAIEQAGGLPVIVVPVEPSCAGALLDRLDGLCLSGGPDIDPSCYGAARHPELGPVEPALDEFEVTLARGAIERGLPVLGICRGAQVLNVARGGTLIQHLPEVSPDLPHRQEEPGTQPTHRVRLQDGSRLAAVIGAPETEVNSFHHQAVDALGSGLAATAWSPDGVVEGIEAPGADGFVVGVQWHIETLVHLPEHAALVEAFIAAARDRSGVAA